MSRSPFSPETCTLVGTVLRRILRPVEPVQARSSPPDPPTEEESPPRPRQPPKRLTKKAKAKIRALTEEKKDTAWDGEFLPIPPNPTKILSQTPDAIAARARRAAKRAAKAVQA
jgi:hypothetical protein